MRGCYRFPTFHIKEEVVEILPILTKTYEGSSGGKVMVISPKPVKIIDLLILLAPTEPGQSLSTGSSLTSELKSTSSLRYFLQFQPIPCLSQRVSRHIHRNRKGGPFNSRSVKGFSLSLLKHKGDSNRNLESLSNN